MSDDWGKAWGEDPDKAKPVAKKKTPRADTLMGLVIHFSELLPKDAWGKLNAPVNAKAMTVGLKKLQTAMISSLIFLIYAESALLCAESSIGIHAARINNFFIG